jgi:hypothetical protein
MLNLPDEFLVVIIHYTAMFSKPVYGHAKLLLAGAILAPGKRTISALLRILGLEQEKTYHKYHRVLSLANWSALQGAAILLSQLLRCFLPSGEVVFPL